MDPNLKHVQVQEQTRFDPRGGAIRVTTYSYFLGNNGPFTDEFPQGTDTPEAVAAAVQARVTKLVAVGALPAASPGY